MTVELSKRQLRERAARASSCGAAKDAALEALARKFARYQSGTGGPFVTDTGRAISPGKVTRRSWDVRKTPRGVVEPPLKPELAVHPKALTRTPQHPDCKDRVMCAGESYALAAMYTRKELLNGAGLSIGRRRYKIVTKSAGTIGYIDDPINGLEWIKGARLRNVHAKMIDENT